jgi:pimeloyl-ACP methyl ester carboxylesterase
MSKAIRRFWWLVPALLVLAVAGFVAWASLIPAPMPEALAALQSDDRVRVDTGQWLVFQPVGRPAETGFAVYPGGRVDPRAYAPAARAIAAEGYLVVIVPVPLNLAVLAPDRAAEVMTAFPQVRRWAVGGHSLGGSMAARFAYLHPDKVKGLVLWASYPATDNDLSSLDLDVVSISASRDGLATPDKIAASRALLPAGTTWVAVQGGNHAQFGWYGPQDGDNAPAISREAQQGQIVEATLALLRQLQ